VEAVEVAQPFAFLALYGVGERLGRGSGAPLRRLAHDPDLLRQIDNDVGSIEPFFTHTVVPYLSAERLHNIPKRRNPAAAMAQHATSI